MCGVKIQCQNLSESSTCTQGIPQRTFFSDLLMFDTVLNPKSSGVEPCTQDFFSGLTSEQWCEAFELRKDCKQLKDQQECREVTASTAAAVANDVAHDADSELELDLEVMCMIFQASEESKPDFDSFKQRSSPCQGVFDPVRRTKSMKPPAQRTPKRSTFSRATTMP